MKRFRTAVICLLVLGALFAAAGCTHTWKGMGKDMENAGGSMQGD